MPWQQEWHTCAVTGCTRLTKALICRECIQEHYKRIGQLQKEKQVIQEEPGELTPVKQQPKKRNLNNDFIESEQLQKEWEEIDKAIKENEKRRKKLVKIDYTEEISKINNKLNECAKKIKPLGLIDHKYNTDDEFIEYQKKLKKNELDNKEFREEYNKLLAEKERLKKDRDAKLQKELENLKF